MNGVRTALAVSRRYAPKTLLRTLWRYCPSGVVNDLGNGGQIHMALAVKIVINYGVEVLIRRKISYMPFERLAEDVICFPSRTSC